MNTCYPSRTLDKLRTRPAIWIKFMNKAYEKSQIRDVSLDEDHPHSFFKLLKKARGGRSLGLLAFPTFKLYTLELLYLNLEEEVETSTLASIEKTKIKLFIDSARRSLFLKLVEDEKKRLALLKVEADDCEYEDAVTAVAVEARNGMATLWKNVYKDSFDVNKGDWGGPQFTAWAKPE